MREWGGRGKRSPPLLFVRREGMQGSGHCGGSGGGSGGGLLLSQGHEMIDDAGRLLFRRQIVIDALRCEHLFGLKPEFPAQVHHESPLLFRHRGIIGRGGGRSAGGNGVQSGGGSGIHFIGEGIAGGGGIRRGGRTCGGRTCGGERIGAELFEGGDIDGECVTQCARFGARFCETEEAGMHRFAGRMRRGIPDACEHHIAFSGTEVDGGRADGLMAVVRGGDLNDLRLNRAEAAGMSFGEKSCVEDVLAALDLHDVVFFHPVNSLYQRDERTAETVVDVLIFPSFSKRSAMRSRSRT